jgi:superfamily II DNA or RNA helicase
MQTNNQLDQYQVDGINSLAYKFSLGLTRLLFQLATGGGKTVTFAGLIARYLNRNQRRVLILVHRAELLTQARRTLYDWYGIIAEPVTAETKHLPNADVYVAMVETANNRMRKRPNYFGDVGLIIVDECHIGNHKKVYSQFTNSLIIGFTATPISSSKKDPLKNHFEDIVCGIDIPDLIGVWKETGGRRGLTPNRTFHVKNIKRQQLRIKNGEFDEREMGVVYSSPKHVENCVNGYEKHCMGTKTLVFNCNVEHSKLVAQSFILHGYDARHLDATASPATREETLNWFKVTENAILCNVGILTTGFDEPSTMSIIVNKSTLSLPLWLQMTGRGSRCYTGKQFFTIVDMGGNAMYHGDWCAARDWSDIFHNPDKPSEGGVAPVKTCPDCEAIIHASARVCPFCQANVAAVPLYDDEMVEFELLTTERPLPFTVVELVTETAEQGRKDYAALHQMKTKMVAQARSQWGIKEMSDAKAYKLLEMYQERVKEWCKIKGKNYNAWHRDTSTQWFFEELKRVFNWEPQKLEIAV